MPCDTTPRYLDDEDRPQTKEERRAEAKDTIRRLEEALRDGTVSMGIGPTGGVVFKGWKDRRGVSDACAYRALRAKGSPEMRKALARAEVTSGRKVDEKAVASGVHSHDDGKTWGKDDK